MTGRGRKLFLCSLLLCTNIAFIWGNSMLSSAVSSQISQTVMEIAEKILRSPLFEKVSVHLIDFLNGLLNTTIPNENVGEHLLRKMAHFTEFCWLGLTLTWFFLILEQKGIHSFAMPLLGGMTVACIDETIQLYSPGRSASLVDVWIDVCGVILGIMILLIGHYMITFRKRRKKSNFGGNNMKKLISMLLALVMVFGLTACGGAAADHTEAPTQALTGPRLLEGTMEELVNQVIEKNPVEFMGGFIPVDLADTSEDGLWAIQYNTGLENADQIQDMAVYEPMMGSIAFSLVMVRVQDTGVETRDVAEAMKAGIDTRKWICVEADDLLVAGFGDVVMLIMLASDSGMTAQSFVDAFQSVCAAQYEGAELDFVI